MAMRYHELTLMIASRQDGKFDASASSDLFPDTARITFARPLARKTLVQIHAQVDQRIAGGPGDCKTRTKAGREQPGLDPREVGAKLYSSLFRGETADFLRRCRAELPHTAHAGLRIRLRFHPRDAQASYLADLPWELLYDPEDGAFLAADNRTPVVRTLITRHPKERLEVAPPLRILVVDAVPDDMKEHNRTPERRLLQEALRTLVKAGYVRILPPPRPTYGGVRDALRDHDPHVLDFLGHGSYNAAAHWGQIWLEDGAGETDMVDGERLADLLKGIPSLRLVALNACKSARHGGMLGAPRFYGAASGVLTLVGLPAVVANQYTISHGAAVQFSATFYGRLAKGDAVDEALAEARLRRRGESFEWATPVLFLSAADGELFRVTPRPGVREAGDAAPAGKPTAPRVRLGIRSMVGLGPELEREADHTLDLTRLFDTRFDNRRYIKNPEDWQAAIYPEVRAFLAKHSHDPRQPIALDLAAHQSIAFTAGWVYEAKSGLDVSVKQRTQGGRGFEWHPNDGTGPAEARPAKRQRPTGRPVHRDSPRTRDVLWQARKDIELDPAGTDVAVALSITHSDVAEQVREFVERQSLPIGRIIDAVIAPEPGQQAVKGGQHALRLAHSLLRRVRTQRPAERGGRLHLFGAGPNAFFFYLGQVSRSLGRIVLYEFAFGSQDSFGRYQKSIELPAADEVQDLPPGW